MSIIEHRPSNKNQNLSLVGTIWQLLINPEKKEENFVALGEQGEAETLTVALTKNLGLLQWKEGMEVGTLEWKGLQRPVKDLGMVGDGEREWCSVENMGLGVKRVVAVAEAIWGSQWIDNRKSKAEEEGLWCGMVWL